MPSKKQPSRRPLAPRRGATRKDPKASAANPPTRPAEATDQGLHSLLTDLPIGVYRTTPGGRILFANPVLLRMLDFSSFVQLARRNLEKSEIGPRYSRQDFKERMAREGEIRGLEAEWQRRDGSTIIVRENARAVRGADGRIRCYEGTIEDITHARTVEKAVREERARLWTVLEALPTTVCLQGPDHRLRFANAAFRERFGNDDMRAGYEVRHGRSTPCEPCPTSQAFETGRSIEREWTDPAGRTYVLHSLPFCDTDGSTLALGIGIDITESKRAQAESHATHAKLEALWSVSSLSAADTKSVADHILASIARMTESQYGFYGFINESETVMTIHSWSGEAMKDCSLVDKPRAEAIRRRAPLILNDYAAAHPAKRGLPEGHVQLTKLLVVPHLSNGRITAVAAVANRQADYDEEDVTQLTTFLNSVQAITDSKRAEEALRRSEEKYRRIVETAHEGIWAMNTHDATTFVNARMADMLGYTPEEMLGRPVREFMLAEDHEDHARKMEACQRGERAIYERRLRRRSGELGTFLVSAAPLADGGSGDQGFLAMFTDITARKELEEKYQSLFRNMLNGFALHEVICDAGGQPVDYRFLAVNPAFERMTGLKETNLIGRTVLEMLPGTERHWIDTYGLVALTGEPSHFESHSGELDKHFEVTAFRPAPNQFACIFVDITERKLVEEALRRSEATLRGILRAAPVGIGTVTQRVIGWVNSQVEQISGYSLEELRGRSARMLYPNDEEYERVGTLKYAQIRERGFGSVESRWQRKDGAIIEVLLSSSPIVDGAVDGEVAFTVLDITQRKLAEQAVRDKAEELDAFFSSSLDLLAIADANGHFRRLNREWETTLGYPLHDLEGRRFLDLVHPDDLPATVEAAAVLDKGQQPILNFTNRYRCADGSYRWIEWRSVPKGKLIYAAARDITERRRAEEALREAHGELERRVEERTLELARANEELLAEITERRRAEEALRESHALLESVLHNTSDEIHLKDLEGRYVFLNPAAAEAMQRPAEEIIGRRDSDLHPPELAEPLIREDRQVIETGKPISYGRTISLNDRTRYALTTKVAHRDAEGRVIGVLGIGRDITDYKETQERVARAERLGSIGVLAAGLAHEINNPVGMILLSAENAISLRNESDAPQIMERTLRNIISDAERCSRIVKNLLRFARQERTAKTPGDLNVVLERACAAMRNIVRPTGSVIETAFSPDLPHALVNPIEMSQVFVNLIQNAVSSAERAVRICIKTERTAAGVRVVVEDDGEGLTEEERKHIFDPFYTTKRTRGGMGLGLSIGHGIVTEHGGSIEVRSRLGHGTVVSVELPAVAGEREVEQGHAESAGC